MHMLRTIRHPDCLTRGKKPASYHCQDVSCNYERSFSPESRELIVPDIRAQRVQLYMHALFFFLS